MPNKKIYLFSNSSDNVTTRVVPVRFRRAAAGGNNVALPGMPSIDERDALSTPIVGALLKADAGAVVQVAIVRDTLGNDASLVVTMPDKLSTGGAPQMTAPRAESFDLAFSMDPSLEAPYVGEIQVHWATPTDVVLATLRVRVLTTITTNVNFYLVTVGAKIPKIAADDIGRYMAVVNSIYEAAGVVFTWTIDTLVSPGDPQNGPDRVGKDDNVRFNADVVVLLRAAQAKTSSGINVLIVDTMIAPIAGFGVSQRMVEKIFTAQFFNSQFLGDSLKDMADNTGIIPPKDRDQEVQLRSAAGLVVGSLGGFVKDNDGSSANAAARHLQDYLDFLASRFVMLDPEGNIRDGLLMSEVAAGDQDATKPGKKLIVRFGVPGIVLALSNGVESTSLAETDVWGRTIAHEIGHFFNLFHPNDPGFEGAIKSDDIWSRRRLMFSNAAFNRDQGPSKSVVGVRDVGYGRNTPGSLLTHSHIGNSFLEPPDGEIETVREFLSAWIANL